MQSCSSIIDTWKAHLAAYPNILPLNQAKIKLIVDGEGGGVWRIENSAITQSTESSAADATLKMSNKTFLNLVTAEENPQVAYLRGEFSISGEELLILPLYKLFNIKAL
jgi:putative sterol carrier protein